MDDNPFASPQTCDLLSPSASQTAELPSLARDGKLIVMHRRTELPPVCVKSGLPAEGKRIRKRLSWVHPVKGLCLLALLAPVPVVALLSGGILMLLATMLLFVIGLVVSIMVGREFIGIPLSAEWRRKRRRGFFLVGGGMIAFFGAILFYENVKQTVVHAGQFGAFFFAIFTWQVAAVACFLYGVYASHLVAIKRIQGDYVWLEGAREPYLELLPPWPVDAKVD